MAFGKGTQRPAQDQTAFEPVYLKLSEGERIVRILDQEETEFWRYWLSGPKFPNLGKGKSIVVGKSGPIRSFMDEIGEEDPSFRKVQRRFLLNVLDRTPVKKTSKGIAVYANAKGQFPGSFDDEDLSTRVIAPNNKVLVMEFGSTLLEGMAMVHDSGVRSRTTHEPLSIWEYDIKITTRGTGMNTVRLVLPDQDQAPLPDELFALSKYDLSTMVRPMPIEAQERLLNGDDYSVVIKELGWDRPQAIVPQF